MVSQQGNVVGLITSRDVAKVEHSSNAAVDEKGRLRVGAAIGVQERDMERAVALVEAGQTCWCWISLTGTPTTASTW